jgi:hypothetical protein
MSGRGDEDDKILSIIVFHVESTAAVVMTLAMIVFKSTLQAFKGIQDSQGLVCR